MCDKGTGEGRQNLQDLINKTMKGKDKSALRKFHSSYV
jgi:hypothetical protein